MVKYRLTKKGKVVVVLLCTFMLFSVSLGISLSKDNPANPDYGKVYAAPNEPVSTRQQQPPAEESQRKPTALGAELIDKLKVSVFFDADAKSFNKAYTKDLDAFLEAAAQYDNVKIQIEGNCATVFDDKSKEHRSANYSLSRLRAEAIANYLKDKGISPDRLVVVANGSDKPLKDNNTPTGREYNRRVDVFFLSK